MRTLKKYIPTGFAADGSVYNKAAADNAVTFINCLNHTKGEWYGTPFELIDWQEQIIRDLFGILKPDGFRQFNSAYIEIPKKQGKSELAAAVALLLTCGDHENGGEGYGHNHKWEAHENFAQTHYESVGELSVISCQAAQDDAQRAHAGSRRERGSKGYLPAIEQAREQIPADFIRAEPVGRGGRLIADRVVQPRRFHPVRRKQRDRNAQQHYRHQYIEAYDGQLVLAEPPENVF